MKYTGEVSVPIAATIFPLVFIGSWEGAAKPRRVSSDSSSRSPAVTVLIRVRLSEGDDWGNRKENCRNWIPCPGYHIDNQVVGGNSFVMSLGGDVRGRSHAVWKSSLILHSTRTLPPRLSEGHCELKKELMASKCIVVFPCPHIFYPNSPSKNFQPVGSSRLDKVSRDWVLVSADSWNLIMMLMVPNPTTDVAGYNSLVSHSLCCIDNPVSFLLLLWRSSMCLSGLAIITTSFCKEVSWG